MELNDLPIYEKIPEDIRYTLDNMYDEIQDSKLYLRPYDSLCYLEDHFQAILDQKVLNGDFSYENENDKHIILLRTFARMLALDCLAYDTAENKDAFLDKIKDIPNISEKEIDNLRRMDREQFRELFS